MKTRRIKAPAAPEARLFTLPGHVQFNGRTLKMLREAGKTVDVVSPQGEGAIVRLPRPAPTAGKLPTAHVLHPDAETEKMIAPYHALIAAPPASLKADTPESLLRTGLMAVNELVSRGEHAFVKAIAHQAAALIAAKARGGSGEALHRYATLTVELAEGLSEMTKRDAEALRPVARECWRWPQMRSRSPRLCDPDSALDEIELSKALPARLDRYSKWKGDYAANVAVRLHRYIDGLRCDDTLAPMPDGSWKPLGAALPNYEQDSAILWWPVAERALLESYPRPEELPEFRAIRISPSRGKSPGRTREAILSAIRARFIAIAPLPASYQS